MDLRAGDEAVFAQYDSFQVDSAEEYYRLHLEGYHGTAGEGSGWGRAGGARRGEERTSLLPPALPGDSMSYHSGSVFCPGLETPTTCFHLLCRLLPGGLVVQELPLYANLSDYGSTVDHQVRRSGGPHQAEGAWGSACLGVCDTQCDRLLNGSALQGSRM